MQKRGFTLIEILVVIAIIGILATIILSSLSTARNKAQDSKIQSQLASMRSAAEVYYNGNRNSYGPSVSDCFTSGTLFTDVGSGMQLLASTTPGIICGAETYRWAAAAPLISNPSAGWCVDSTGRSEPLDAMVTESLLVCP